MALLTQRHKRKIEIQPTKVRLRLVQVGASFQPATGILGSGETSLPGLNYLPIWVTPGAHILVGTTASAEIVTVTAIDPETNTLTITATGTSRSGRQYITPAGFGRTTVLGRVFWASRLGINGVTAQGRGYSEGKYERILNNEQPHSIEVPNAVGTDGLLHRERFLMTAEGVTYRPGDEWIEVWRSSGDSAAGQLLYVGAPTTYTINEEAIQLEGFCAYWTLRKQREGTAGWYTNAPRDVFEQFTKAAVVVIADDFLVPSNFPEGREGAHTSVDGRWIYHNAVASPIPSNVRLISGPSGGEPGGSGGGLEYSTLQSNASFPIGTTSANAHNRWRVESTVTISALSNNANFGMGVSPNGGTTLPANFSIAMAILEGSSLNVQLSGVDKPLSATQTVTVQQVTTSGTAGISAGQHSMAIEGRDRWLYFYFDGALIFSYAMPETTLTVKPYVYFQGKSSVAYVDVDNLIARVWEPYLLGSGEGDLRLPGAPSQGGLQGVYFNDWDLYAANASDRWNRQFNPATRGGLAAATGGSSAVYAEKIDPSITFTGGSGWEPPGLPEHLKFSARWTGSIYLDLASFDYKLTTRLKGGVRIWVGKTRIGEQLINSPNTFTDFHENSYYILNTAQLRSVLGNTSGWYPIIIEYQAPGTFADSLTGSSGNGIVLTYTRSDFPNLEIPLNVGPYSYLVLAGASQPKKLYVFDRWLLEGFEEKDSLNAGANDTFSLLGRPNNTELGEGKPLPTYSMVPGAVANDRVLSLAPNSTVGSNFYTRYYPNAPSTTAGKEQFNTTGFTGWTIECWIKPTTPAKAEEQILFRKEFVWQLSLTTAGKLRAVSGNGTAFSGEALSAAAVTAGQWQHVAGTYDGKKLRVYVNGVLVGTAAGETTGQFGAYTGANPATIGYWNNHGGSDQSGLDAYTGGISHLALYDKALSEATLLSHFQAASASVVMNKINAVSYVPASPQGIFEQLVRNDSHQAQIQQLIENFGYQMTCAPRALETGEFPGRMLPVVRQGHDTDYVLDHSNTLNPSVQAQADDVADTELVDAQGIADPSNQSQLYAEIFDFEEITQGGHMLLSTEYDSPGDIQTPQQLVQRGSSLLALRKNPWTVITGSTAGHTELTDTFPVTGSNWSEFSWLPGDGIRYHLPLLNIEDRSTRQLYDVAWAFFPDGLMSPTVSVLARPKTLRETLKRIQRESIDESRNYQGQLVAVNGTNGAGKQTGTAEAPINTGAAADIFSRIALPANLASVKSLVLIVQFISGPATTWNVSILGALTPIVITGPGRYDLTAWLKRDVSTATSRLYATLLATNHTGGETFEISLEALVRV